VSTNAAVPGADEAWIVGHCVLSRDGRAGRQRGHSTACRGHECYVEDMIATNEILDLQQAAELLHTSTRTLRRWVAAEKVPAARFGNKLLFSREALLRLVDEGGVKS
jgi:excisionase family DNA binding protein